MNKLKYHIAVIGCQMNISDAERISGILEDLGLESSKSKENAKVIIAITCGIRKRAEDKIYGLIPKIKKHKPETIIILTGCLSRRKDVFRRLNKHVDIWMHTSDMENLAQEIHKKIPNLKKENNPNIKSLKNYLSLKPKYSSAYSAFVPIGSGCNNWCTYCVVPKARGKEVYRDPEEIINEIKDLVSKNYKEITLIAQNVDSYNHISPNGKKTNFAELFKLVDNINGYFWLRFSTSHPKDISEELINALKNGSTKICPHIHLPVQSGDDNLLKAMNRHYTSKKYLNLIKNIRVNLDSELPVAITTDVIVGYPNETREQFNNSAALLKKAQFDMAYISQYSPRPGTASYHLKDNITQEEKKQREVELTKIIQKSCEKNNIKYIGKTLDAIVIGEKNGNILAKTKTSKNIKIKQNKILKTGEFVKIKITQAKNLGLYGKIIDK